MRLLLVIPSIASFRAFLSDLAAALTVQQAEVHCACSVEVPWGSPEQLANCSARIHRLPFTRGMSPAAHWHSARLLDRLVSLLRPDLVHAHFSSAIFATALARRRHWPLTVGTFQGVSYPLTWGFKGRLLKLAETWAASRLDAVWVLTEDDRVELSQAAPNAIVKKQSAFGFGCDLEQFNPLSIRPDERDALRSRLGLTPAHRVFAFVGRYVHFKGFNVVVRAFSRLAQDDSDARLLLIGTRDPLHPTGLTPSEEEALRHSPQVLDVGWQTDVQKYLAIIHVLVFPSQREGMPVCLMEALAMGVPVITCNSRGCRDVVRDQEDGIVLPTCTPDELAAAMRCLSSDTERRNRLAAAALAGRERFSRLNYVEEQMQIYQALLNEQESL